MAHSEYGTDGSGTLKDRFSSFSEIASLHDSLRGRFISFYAREGYLQYPAQPIYPQDDDSVLFVGSTISPLKKTLLDGQIPDGGISIVQPCLRTHTQDYLYDDTQISEYNSYFTQAGILTGPGNYESVCEQSRLFLTKALGIRPTDILVRLSTADRDLCIGWSQNNSMVRAEYDTRDAAYYGWKYGMEGVRGRGLTYAVRASDTQAFQDIGNVILIEREGVPIAVEWGFGVETLLSRIYGAKKPLETSTMSKILPYTEGMNEKLSDTLAASVAMMRSGVEPGRGKASHVLKVYLKALRYYIDTLSFDESALPRLVQEYEQLEFGNDLGTGSRILAFTQEHRKRLEAFARSVKEIYQSCAVRGISPQASIMKQIQQYGIHIVEAKQILGEKYEE